MSMIKSLNYTNIAMLALLVISSLTVSVPAYSGGVVIVHPSNTNTLSIKMISKIFLGKKKTFTDGSQAIPLDTKNGDTIRNNFVSTVLKKNNQQIKAYWSQLLFTGRGRPPREIDDDASVKKLVAENPALIGYIDTTNSDSSVKVVLEF